MILLADTTDNALNWTVLTPVVAGALAIWYLLPSPQKRPLFGGAIAGVVALAGLAGFLLQGLGQTVPATVEAILFFGFAGTAVLFAALMITNPNPGRSALCFAMVVLSTCGLFLLLAAPFLMAATIIIYAGAIIVTFLFVIMLSHQNGPSNADLRSREPVLAVGTGFVLLATLLVGLQRVYDNRSVESVISESIQLAASEKVDSEYLTVRKDGDMGKPVELTPRAKSFVSRSKAALARMKLAAPEPGDKALGWDIRVRAAENAIADLERTPFKDSDMDAIRDDTMTIAASLTYLKRIREGGIPHEGVTLSPYGQVRQITKPGDNPESFAEQPPEARSTPVLLEPDPDLKMKKMPSANIAALGRVLFTDHLLAVELAGTLLLVATVGAIVIAGGRREHPR
ncbi:NADH-quinone oxidoreductase subunit J [Zavarzinella formosa]|uniref:NADH-quinone oxidoreductase subunit J n=1 Tax=Zavarzinella formosa TaxID=360055 RepID=UPI0002DF8239|nr:NADH-quinone oxidoreductase subunit J [Zavarzinella formosa]